jgi:peptide/nickel transport system substrate-binding protein
MARDQGRDDGQHFDWSLLETEMTRREVLKGAAAMGALLGAGPLIAACGGGSSPEPASSSAAAAPKKGGHLRVGMSIAGTHIDPQLSTTNDVISMDHNVFDTLMAWDPSMKLVNGLAEEVTPNAKATEYTVRLQPDVTFHNGKALTADDVIFSFERILDPKAPKVGASMLSHVKDMKKMDDLTVRFSLAHPDAIFPQLLAQYSNCILPTGFKQSSKPEDLVGTGPFKITGYTELQQVDLQANADYWGQAPYVDTMTWHHTADESAMLNGLLGGTYDWVPGMSATQGKIVDKTNGLGTVRTHSGTYIPFMMNCEVKPFTDARVRQAFKLLCARQKTLDAALDGSGAVGNDIYSPYDPACPTDLPQREQDLEQAASLLKQAGYSDLSVQCDVCPGNGSAAVDCAVIMAEDAKKAGVTIKVNKIDGAEFYGENWTTYPFSTDIWATRNYIMAGRIVTYPDAAWNCQHWTNDQWLALMHEAEQTVDATKQNDLLAQAMKISRDDDGYIVWSFMDLIDGHSTKVAGAVQDVFYFSAIKFNYKSLYFV